MGSDGTPSSAVMVHHHRHIEHKKSTGRAHLLTQGGPVGPPGRTLRMDPDWDPPKKRRGRGWGVTAERVLGADDTPKAETKRVNSTPSRAVTKTRDRFVAKFTPLAEKHNVPVMGSRGKMHNNIRLLLDDGYTEDILDRAWEYFAGMVPSLYLADNTLWDLFFARRMEALKFAAVAVMGTHGGPRESLEDKGRRLMTRTAQQKEQP